MARKSRTPYRVLRLLFLFVFFHETPKQSSRLFIGGPPPSFYGAPPIEDDVVAVDFFCPFAGPPLVVADIVVLGRVRVIWPSLTLMDLI